MCRHILYVPAEPPVGDVNISILCWAQTADITTLARLGWAAQTAPSLKYHFKILLIFSNRTLDVGWWWSQWPNLSGASQCSVGGGGP